MSKKSLLLTLACFVSASVSCRAQTASELVAQAEVALRSGLQERALALLNEAIQKDSRYSQAYLFRGGLLAESGESQAAIDDFSRAVDLNPQLGQAYNLRGMERFKVAEIEGALRDFDQAIELDPRLEPYHWQRGLALYYAGRYREGQRQFELHRSVNAQDVENAVWHFLCVARQKGVAEARQVMIPIKYDGRVPMMEIDALFRGTGEVAAVMQAAQAGNLSQTEQSWRLFYAHLYLGLYHEALGDLESSLEHIQSAVQHAQGHHYMSAVPRVHWTLAEGKTP